MTTTPNHQLIEQTLSLPPEIPLFQYNVNFNGVKKLIEQSGIKINDNANLIKVIQEDLQTKWPIEHFKAHEKTLNNSLKLGLNTVEFFKEQDNAFLKNMKVNTDDQKSHTEEFAWKLGRIAEVVDVLLNRVAENTEKISADDKRNEKAINDSFRRLEQRLESGMNSFNKTINNYFTESNKKVSTLQSDFRGLKLSSEVKIKQLQDAMNTKLSENLLNASLEDAKNKILQQINSQIQSDQMKRMSTLQDLKNQLQEAQKAIDIQNKATKQKVGDLDAKVQKAMGTKMFQMQKHKIYEKLSEFKNKTDELTRKNNQFVDFRKNYLTDKEKTRQQFIGLEDEIKKLNDKESSFKKMENVSDILQSLDPHLICEIGNQVKLHEKSIGKLEKKLALMDGDIKDVKNTKNTPPPVNTGENSDMIQKIFKEYLANMDFQGRVKKVERDLHEVSRRTDVFHDLQKKIYALSKDLDVSSINKQLKKKADEDNTRRQLKICDTKIENLFDYFKTIRRELDIMYKKAAMGSAQKDTLDNNPALTSKRLLGASCLSCPPQTAKIRERRTYSKQKIDLSFDETNMDYLKSTVNFKNGK